MLNEEKATTDDFKTLEDKLEIQNEKLKTVTIFASELAKYLLPQPKKKYEKEED